MNGSWPDQGMRSLLCQKFCGNQGKGTPRTKAQGRVFGGAVVSPPEIASKLGIGRASERSGGRQTA